MGPSAQSEMLILALRKGESHRGNRRIEFEGTCTQLPSFEFGYATVMTGKLTCWYYSSKILGVDFDKKRITDFGMEGYSLSTSKNIRLWKSALDGLLRSFTTRGFCISSDAIYRSSGWTGGEGNYADNKQGWGKRRERFRSMAPWVYKDANGVRWFDWELFDEGLSETYYESGNDLSTNQAWRYYTYDWDAQGKWSKRFIDADAERRYLANQKKKKRGPRGNVP